MEAAKHTPGQSPWPRAFATPEGRKISVRAMGAALSRVRRNPDLEYCGWNWFPTPGHLILREFRRGLHHRINMRAAIARALSTSEGEGS